MKERNKGQILAELEAQCYNNEGLFKNTPKIK